MAMSFDTVWNNINNDEPFINPKHAAEYMWNKAIDQAIKTVPNDENSDYFSGPGISDTLHDKLRNLKVK